MEQTFDPNAVDYSGVEPGADMEFRRFKPGTYDLEVKAIDWLVDDKQRQNLRFRFELVDGQEVELIPEEGDEHIDPAGMKPGSIFERFWFHTPKAIPIFARFLEKCGLSWADYVASPDKKSYVETLKGRVIKAVVTYNEEFEKNEIKKVLKS